MITIHRVSFCVSGCSNIFRLPIPQPRIRQPENKQSPLTHLPISILAASCPQTKSSLKAVYKLSGCLSLIGYFGLNLKTQQKSTSARSQSFQAAY
nr:hypothetical protein [uncultured Kingella sp.]